MQGVAVPAGRGSVSVGCAWSAAGGDPAAAMARADDALFAAKRSGGNRLVVQGDAEGTGNRRFRTAVDDILAQDGGIYSLHQPIVRLGDRATVGWEVLSRPNGWSNGDVEALFLTAHRMGRGRDLDWRCRRNALWEAPRFREPLFVNISVAGLVDPVHDVDQMLLLCDWSGHPPESIVLELSERDATPDLRRLEKILADYRRAGFRFALDDLGAGNTTLGLVLAARAEFLKLARPLVQAAQHDTAVRNFTSALVTFAHGIGSTVIAEGVEDEPHRELCQSLEIDLGQGWLFGRPERPDSSQ
jgi:EAL domain-containing protein (putative c-di-GMP-specific phosphodiesterase class I)